MKKYLTFFCAAKAAQNLKIKNSNDYQARFRLDKKLPSKPYRFYEDWQEKGGWNVFLGKEVHGEYETWKKASEAAKQLEITDSNDYLKKYILDPRLPRKPMHNYNLVWELNGYWDGFLGRREADIYPSFDDASKAAISLNIRGVKEYQERYKEDIRLPSSPYATYRREWNVKNRWKGFLGKGVKNVYPTWEEASQSAINLGVRTHDEYKKRYKEDPRLPGNPAVIYHKDWLLNQRWSGFLGKKSKYTDVYEASKAAQKLGVKTLDEYRRRYNENPGLVKYPEHHYGKDLEEMGGMRAYLGVKKLRSNSTSSKKYGTWEESSKAARKLKIKNSSEYRRRFKEDPKLHNYPPSKYPSEWEKNGGWIGFLGLHTVQKYETWEEASDAVKKLGIKNCVDYRKRYKEDPKLHVSPWQFYASDWKRNGAWKGFTTGNPLSVYKTWGEAAHAARQLNISGATNYISQYMEDPRLPFDPERQYPNEWHENGKWDGFLGRIPNIYDSWEDASGAARRLKIFSRADYKKRYKEDPKLRSCPDQVYYDKWKGLDSWHELLPREIDSLEALKAAIKYLGCKSYEDYVRTYKDYPFAKLPRNPNRSKNLRNQSWPGWKVILGISFYRYEVLKDMVQAEGVKGQNGYKRFRIDSGDIKIPASPEECYSEWENWYVFLGKPEPYQEKYIKEPYLEWKKHFNSYLKVAKASSVKETAICRFLRGFIVKNNFPTCPVKFLFTYGTSKTPGEMIHELDDKYTVFMDSVFSRTQHDNSYKLNQAVTEFFDYIIDKYLMDELEDGGCIPLVRNPFHYLSKFTSRKTLSPARSETNKNILPYQYIQDARKWIFPVDSACFSDLKHLYDGFTADWFRVEKEVIDRSDPDCVWEIREHFQYGRSYYIWSPVSWVLAYALLNTPFRGIQLAYNDSGEADHEIPILENGRDIHWTKNDGHLAGQTKNQGFIQRYPNNEIGSYCTTNKTHNQGAGYSIPWMEEDLARWLIRLRNWQSKYNPLQKPTSWTGLKRTNLNETQLKARGENCFLFRDFGREEPGNHSSLLSSRLAAALYNIQDRSLPLASVCAGKEGTLSRYSSVYTPHSVRASLITAYIMDFGLPPHVVMKVVGHASLVQTIYYSKPGVERLRDAISIGEKRALQSRGMEKIRLIREGRITDVKNELVSNSDNVIASLNENTSPVKFTFTDQGFCPFAGGRCHEGGEEVEKSKVFAPVPEGYAGKQNCIRCRFFVSGPAFIGGLLSLSNEIFLAARNQSLHMEELREKFDAVKRKIRELEIAEYDSIRDGTNCFSGDDLFKLENQKSKLASELERATKKLDMLLCDINAANKLITQSQALINDEVGSKGSVKLIKQPDFKLEVEPIETSYFHQLSEICANAEVYESASASSAVVPRSQIIDRMAVLNGMNPMMLMLTEEQQLIVGNQMSELLISRLNSWARVDSVLSGKILLEDLSLDEKISPIEIKSLFSSYDGGEDERARRVIK